MNMNDPRNWLLIVTYSDGERACINLWQAIEEGRMTVKANPLCSCRVVDIAADEAANREGLKDITDREGLKSRE